MINPQWKYASGNLGPYFNSARSLSGKKFKFQRGRLDAKRMPADGTVKASFTVKNTGSREGDEVAQVYFRHVHSDVPQPKLTLCGFARVHLNRGETDRVTVEVPAERLRCWDTEKKQYMVEPGKYEFLIGAASDNIRLKLPMTI